MMLLCWGKLSFCDQSLPLWGRWHGEAVTEEGSTISPNLGGSGEIPPHLSRPRLRSATLPKGEGGVSKNHVIARSSAHISALRAALRAVALRNVPAGAVAWQSPSNFKHPSFYGPARTLGGDCHVALRLAMTYYFVSPKNTGYICVFRTPCTARRWAYTGPSGRP